MQKDNEAMIHVIWRKAGISRCLNQKLVAVVDEEILQPARDLCSALGCPALLSQHLPEWNKAGTQGRSSRQNLHDIKIREDYYLSCSLDVGLEAVREKARVLLTCFSLKISHLACLSHELAGKSGRGKEKKLKKPVNSGVKWLTPVTENVSIWGETGKKTWEWAKPGRFSGQRCRGRIALLSRERKATPVSLTLRSNFFRFYKQSNFSPDLLKQEPVGSFYFCRSNVGSLKL